MHTKRGPGPPIPGRRAPDGVDGGGGRRLRDTAGRALPPGRRENAGNQSPLPLIHDSSPRERGKRVDAVHPHAGVGLIPAHAGNTRREILYADPRSGNPPWASLEIIDRRKARAMGPAPAHPRAGVENTPRIPATASCCGSSPRGRGKRRRAVPGAAGQRLIPARAGKTPSPRQCPATSSAHPRAGGENKPRGILASGTRAHPRAYGENGEHCAYPVEHPGSSPRVRGKLAEGGNEHVEGRLIPARAGKTRRVRGPAGGPWAHPRACGENQTFGRLAGSRTGSSPRVRGKRDLALGHGVPEGLIPERAGKTDHPLATQARSAAHPRACGENVFVDVVPSMRGAHPRACGENDALTARYMRGDGSSPRVRGKPGRACPPGEGPGLIPACAGKTRCRRPTGEEVTAHPRACGENGAQREISSGGSGSSPRVRGKRNPRRNSQRPPRLIPARAGKTTRPSTATGG